MSYRVFYVLAWTYGLVLVGGTSTAAAQRAVLLPTEGSVALATVRETLVSVFVARLREGGFEVQGPEARAVDLLECDSGACSSAVLEGLGAEFGVALAVWVRTRGGAELAVTLYMPDGTTRDLAGAIEGDGRATATSLADDAARSMRTFEPVAPSEASTPEAARTSRPSVVNYVLGGAGLALAVPMLTSAVVTIARHGDCVSTESGDCSMPAGITRVVDVGPRTVAFLVAGSGLVAVSTYLLAKRPLRVAVAADADGVSFHAQARF